MVNRLDLVFKSNVDSVLEGATPLLRTNIKIIIDLLVGMSQKRFQNMMITSIIDKLQTSQYTTLHSSASLANTLRDAATNNSTKVGGTANGGFITNGSESVPQYNSSNMNNRTNTKLTSEMTQIRQLLFDKKYRDMLADDKSAQEVRRAGFDYEQPLQQQQQTIIKERVIYPEQSVYSGYGRPKMMTEIDQHMPRPDKPIACIPQEKMPNGPVPMFEYANVADYTGVGSMLPVFVYDETYDNKYYKRLYQN